jgi:hypothetical protein
MQWVTVGTAEYQRLLTSARRGGSHRHRGDVRAGGHGLTTPMPLADVVRTAPTTARLWAAAQHWRT